MTVFDVTATALVVKDPNLSPEAWQQYGAALGVAGRTGHKFHVGDWLLAGEQLFGEQVAQWVDATGHDEAYLAAARRVAERVPPDRRRAELSWTHHALVASLLPEEQQTFLQTAVEKGWGRKELAVAITEAARAGLLSVKPRKVKPKASTNPTLAERFAGVLATWRSAGEPDGDPGLVEALVLAAELPVA